MPGAASGQVQEAPWPTSGWATTTPEAVGLDPAPLRELHRDVVEGVYGYIDRLVVVKNGYLVVNDVTVRDWQLRTPTWTMGKSFDTHGPIGPWIVTSDELRDPHQLRLRTWVNGELRQESNTKELIFDCFALVEHFSTAFTLEPGDIVATGTPSGVGIIRKPPQLLKSGRRAGMTPRHRNRPSGHASLQAHHRI